MKFSILLLSFLISFWSRGAQSSSGIACNGSDLFEVESLQIEGNIKTQSSVILNELKFAAGRAVCNEQISESLENLQGLGLFSSVSIRTVPSENNRVQVLISVEEKWTSIPIFKINSGGGVTQYTLGVYDPNIFGAFKEAGFQYENLAGTSSGVIWFKNPRLFDKRQGIDAQYWNTRRIRIKYDLESEDAKIKAGFLQRREKIYLEYFREFKKEITWKVSAEFNDDAFSSDNLPDDVIEKIELGMPVPPSTKFLISRIGTDVGRIRGEAQMLEGSLLSLSVAYASPLQHNLLSFTQADLSFVWHQPLGDRWQWAQRFLVGGTSTDTLQYWYYLGGLDRIRGFSDNRFAGRYFSLSNSELRYVITQSPNYIVQGTGFIDVLGLGEEAAEATSLKALSGGAGVRLILPKFYRFILRLDYAKPLVKRDPMNWSFGVQQFF